MRYEEFGEPLAGWTYDEKGTIYTASGYRCTGQQIEGLLWLFGCLPYEPEKYLIHSDEAAGAMRPLYERSDIDPKGQVTPTRVIRQTKAGSAGRCSAMRPTEKETRQQRKAADKR